MLNRTFQSLWSASRTRVSSSTLPVAAPLSSLSSSPLSHSIRHIHNPRTIRGVGPAPRKPSFYRQPWIRRRMTRDRARKWTQTHGHYTPLQTQVQQQQQQQIEIATRDIESGQQTGTVSLNSSVFNVPLRRDVIWEVVRWQRAMRRQGTHKEKDRSEVYGSGKKARPQKGSGRARIGDVHAPHHFGGGHAFPRRPSDYRYNLPRSVINIGKRVALTAKLQEGNLYVVDAPILSSADQQAFIKAMVANKWGDFLMIHLDGELDPNLAIASRRNVHYQFLSDKELNVYDLLKAKRVVLTKKAAMAIEWRLTPKTDNKLRWMVGSYGGGYTAEQIQFVKSGDQAEGRVVDGVEVDGAKLVIKSEPFQTPIHWP